MSRSGGGLITLIIKQTLNPQSLNELELIAASDMICKVLRMSEFLLEQGTKCESILYQENQSKIRFKIQ